MNCSRGLFELKKRISFGIGFTYAMEKRNVRDVLDIVQNYDISQDNFPRLHSMDWFSLLNQTKEKNKKHIDTKIRSSKTSTVGQVRI